MPILALALLLSSATLHALWNLLLKQSQEKYLAMGWQVIISSIFSIFAIFFTGLPPRSMWLFVLISMTLEAIYFGLLTFAYNDQDFSLIYPVARGAAPVLVVIWTALFLARNPHNWRLPWYCPGCLRINHHRRHQPVPESRWQATIPGDSHCAVRCVGYLDLHRD